MKSTQLIVKKTFDILISIILLILLSPLLLFISILIKLDSKGSVLFIQERLGKDGKVFKIYKFRTMCENAINIGSGIYTDEDDSRITKVGAILRKTSFDELPQLINVLKGEMSLIGPRPPVTDHPYKYEDYNDIQKIRFSFLPGITGYAQINGRANISWNERIKLDVKYVKNYSLLLDIKILFLTIYKVIKKENVY
jgi:lipopolysaccharide/colanic/teichoic acid biosynthesis glycosyltransferase